MPPGWTDVLHASAEQLAEFPGLNDSVRQAAAALDLRLYAMDLRRDSPSLGSSMLLVAMPVAVPVDEAFLDALIQSIEAAGQADATVEKKVLSVHGRALAKWRTEGVDETHGERSARLTYYFTSDSGELMQLAFIVVPAESYAQLRPQIESIER